MLLRAACATFVFSLLVTYPSFGASAVLTQAEQFEREGNASAALDALRDNAQHNPADPAALSAYATFLDRYNSMDARAAYRHWLEVAPRTETAFIERRLIELDLIQGDRAAAASEITAYRAAGGQDLTLPAVAATQSGDATNFIEIPGPLRSFSRMAAISSDFDPEEVLPSLARNLITGGYQAARGNDVLEPTEYLKLLTRYVSQARELETLAGASKVIKIESCESTETGDLLRIIGFRMRGGCGSEVVLETVNASRAFLTTDSGFPLADLEQALRTNQPFAYDYHPSRVPILYSADYWLGAKGKGDFLDSFLSEPSLCRAYLGMAKLDHVTADLIKANVPFVQLRSYANVLDFYGNMFEIRNGRAVVPGGDRSATAWGELVGVSPDKGGQFFGKLLAKDDGWLASLYDSLARINGPVQIYLTDPARMKRFYAAVRGSVTSPGPARPVFRANADMMLLTARLRLDPDGRPHIPGGLDVWKELFSEHSHSKYDAKLARAANGWRSPDDLLEALFALSRKSVENEPLKIFMALSDIDRYRSAPLQAGTVATLAENYRQYGAQYHQFADAPALTDATILQFLATMDAIDRIHELQLRADCAGSFQALMGIWQILERQGSLPVAASNNAVGAIMAPFRDVHSERELFAASRNGIKLLLASSDPNGTAPVQNRMLALLAGGADVKENDARDQILKDMTRGLDAQRVVSLTNLFQAADILEKGANVSPVETAQLQKIASRIAEIQLPRAPLSGAEKNAISTGFWTEKHIDNQRRLNLRAQIDKAARDPEKLAAIQGSLAPLLRDTLVAYDYVHYAPPGAQILYTNPLFVRSHDFYGLNTGNSLWKATDLLGAGWPSNGGGRLVGSLSNLPYALAESEQNFLVPTQTQALIWADLVPQMILGATLPRWWNVTPVQLHWVNLHMQLAETLLAEAALSPALRGLVIDSLRVQASPLRSYRVNHLLEGGEAKEAIDSLTPLEMYVIASDLSSNPSVKDDQAVREIHQIAGEHSSEVSEDAISTAFGTPKPTLANSYRPGLLKLRTFPTLMGYSSRIMAESWESNTLYWAALADEIHMPPSQLNVAIPEWTAQVVERIFASHLEDWPALLRSLRAVGAGIRSGAVVASAKGAGE